MLVVVVFVVDVSVTSRICSSTGIAALNAQTCHVADVVLEEVDVVVACGATPKSDSDRVVRSGLESRRVI